jgi:hypothetical protein
VLSRQQQKANLVNFGLELSAVVAARHTITHTMNK